MKEQRWLRGCKRSSILHLPLTISYNLPAVSNQKDLTTKDTTPPRLVGAGEYTKGFKTFFTSFVTVVSFVLKN
jgi:hypothetical protein